MRGPLYVVATPIGNLEDITLRAVRILREADVIAAEDTRHTRKLLAHLDIHTPLTSFHAHSGAARLERILRTLNEGKTVALVTDAGTPGIADPGQPLIAAAVAEGMPVVPIPGPTAAAAAVSIAGFPGSMFCFLGFSAAPPVPPQARTSQAWRSCRFCLWSMHRLTGCSTILKHAKSASETAKSWSPAS